MMRTWLMILSGLCIQLAAASGASGQQLPVADHPVGASLSASLQATQLDIRRTLEYYYQRPLRVAEKTPWSVMHSLVAFGVDTELDAGNRHVNAIGWLCYNQPARGMRLFEIERSLPAPRQGPGLEGHRGQLLSMLAQSRVRPEYAIKVSGHEFTVADLVRHEQLTCQTDQELTFKLIGLSHYLPSDAQWKNDRGQAWTLGRLIHQELSQSVNGAACGGSHRLMGLSYAVQKRLQRGEVLDGEWKRAAQFLQQFQDYTFTLQNPDGSFSTNWFVGRGNSSDQLERLRTSGHVLEWLAFSLPADQLEDPRLLRSVNYLTSVLWDGRQRQWPIGPLGHALHALVIFNERALEGIPGRPAATFGSQADVSRVP